MLNPCALLFKNGIGDNTAKLIEIIVAGRLIEPASELHTQEWAITRSGIFELIGKPAGPALFVASDGINCASGGVPWVDESHLYGILVTPGTFPTYLTTADAQLTTLASSFANGVDSLWDNGIKGNYWDKFREKHWFLCCNVALGIAIGIVVMIITLWNIYGKFKGTIYSMIIIGCIDIIGFHLMKKADQSFLKNHMSPQPEP